MLAKTWQQCMEIKQWSLLKYHCYGNCCYGDCYEDICCYDEIHETYITAVVMLLKNVAVVTVTMVIVAIITCMYCCYGNLFGNNDHGNSYHMLLLK